MKLSERIALIKAGYNKKEIAEIEAKEQDPEEKPEQKPEEKPEQKPEEKPEQKPEEKPEDPNDIITDLKAQITALKTLVEGIQQENVNKDQGDNLPEDKTGDDILNEVIY